MKTKIFKGIGIVFVVGFCLLFGMVILQMTDQSARSFSGFYEAESLPDAYAYQQKINEAALEADAAILESNIRMTSPPRYTFRIVMPDTTPFEYGEVYPGSTFWHGFGFIGSGICFLVMVLGTRNIIKGSPENKERGVGK